MCSSPPLERSRQVRHGGWRTLAAFGSVILVLATASGEPLVAAEPVYGPPITITEGGVYTGDWQSLDPDAPAVSIRTAEPVTIEGARIRGRGTLIEAHPGHRAKLTVRDTYGYGLNPNLAGRPPGRFLEAEEFDDVLLENNYLEGTSGIYLRKYLGDPDKGHTVEVLRNRARNIDGRHSDGAGGFSRSGFSVAQFLQFNDLRSVPNVEVAWNEVTNEPYESRVEDNVSVYLSSGTPESPILIHDNYVRGAYPARPAGDAYSGGGIMLGDGGSDTVEGAAGFVKAYRNQVVGTTNYGIAIAAGHDNEFYENRIVSSGALADGTPIFAQNVGAYIWDTNGDEGKSPPTFYGNLARDNTAGWARRYRDGRMARNDLWFPGCAEAPDGASWCRGNEGLAGPITPDTEEAEFARWQDKLVTAGVKIGPQIYGLPVLGAIGAQSAGEGEHKNVAVTASDPDGDALDLSASGLPGFAAFTDNGDGTGALSLAPKGGDAGEYQATVSASDGTDSDSETLTITVLSDPDDDDDGRPDTSDPFAIDPNNGMGAALPVRYNFDSIDAGGGLLGLGFTGLMTNGASDYQSLYDPANLTAGGAAGVLTVDKVGPGDAYSANNDQQNGFQFGVDPSATAGGAFTARARVSAPFAGLTPKNYQSMGLFLGAGDQDNYVKLVASSNNGKGGVEFAKEVGGTFAGRVQPSVAMPGPDYVDLYLTVDPAANTVQPSYAVGTGGAEGPRTNLGGPEPIPAGWLGGARALAVGITSTSVHSGTTFPATWDFVEVVPGEGGTRPPGNRAPVLGAIGAQSAEEKECCG